MNKSTWKVVGIIGVTLVVITGIVALFVHQDK